MMFWKKKGYDRDNGGDYIRPSEEYRADCEEYHSHGQTYEDLDERYYRDEYRSDCSDHTHGQTYNDYDSRYRTEEYRADCSDHTHGQTYKDYDSRYRTEEYRADCSDHTHGQTYNDYNSEQRAYDAQRELERQFSARLGSGEYILWCGRAEKGANNTEKGMGFGKSGNGCLLVLILLLIFFPWLGIFGIIIYALSVSGISSRSYAITNKNVLIIKNNVLNSIPLKSIRGVTFFKSNRNIGYVHFMTSAVSYSNSNKNYANEGIFAIKEPQNVAAILNRAISDYRN